MRPAGVWRIVVAVLVSVPLLGPSVLAQQMPDAKQMSGVPLPVGDVAPGTVVVRVVRGSLANPLANETVDLQGGPSAPQTTKTNETGRAEFTGVAPGTRVKAISVVAGERIESQEFTVPATGGIRVMLVATDPEMEKRAAEDRKLAQAPPQPGIVVIGDESRFVFEFGDDSLSVFNILHIVNTARTPVQTPQPLVFEIPEDGTNAATLEGSSPQATLADHKVTVTGPFAPGATVVQFAYSMSYSGSTLTVEQRLPAAMTRLTVLAQKVGATHLTSPQMSEHREMASEGQTYIAGQGPALKAGDLVTFNFTGLPHHPTWPRNLALFLAVVILAAGGWASLRSRQAVAAGDDRRRKLQAKRDRLFNELTTLEAQHKAGSVDARRYADRRRELISGLERIYAELDEEAAA